MKNVQRFIEYIVSLLLSPYMILLLLSLVGAGIAFYLTAVHYEHVPLLCSANGIVDCQRVTSSAYSVVPGTSLPITVPGIGWALVSAVLAILGLRAQANNRRLARIYCIWSLLALLFVLYLVYVEIVLLHAICAWCTGLHIVVLATFLITLVQLLSPSPEADEHENEEPSSLTTASKS